MRNIRSRKFINYRTKVLMYLRLVVPVLMLSLAVGCNKGKTTLDLNVEEFDDLAHEALESRFNVVDEKFCLKNELEAWSGTVNVIKRNSVIQILSIDEGELVSMKMFGDKGGQIGLYEESGSGGLKFHSSVDSVETTCLWESFSKERILNGDIQDEDHSCKVTFYLEGDVRDLNSSVKNKNSFLVSNILGLSVGSNKTYLKGRSIKKVFNDSVVAELTIIENLEDKYKANNDYSPLYSEDIVITKDGEVVRLSTSWNYGGDLFVHVAMDDYDGKNCSEAEALKYSSVFLRDKKFEVTNCMYDVLTIVNSSLSSSITYKAIKQRFEKKKESNMYFETGSDDSRFYFN